MTIYYTSGYDGGKVTAFKPVSLVCQVKWSSGAALIYELHDQGFRMLAGSPMQKTKAGITKWNGICFRCYTAKNFGGDNGAPCSDPKVDSVELPNKICPGGIRTTVRFPT